MTCGTTHRGDGPRGPRYHPGLGPAAAILLGMGRPGNLLGWGWHGVRMAGCGVGRGRAPQDGGPCRVEPWAGFCPRGRLEWLALGDAGRATWIHAAAGRPRGLGGRARAEPGRPSAPAGRRGWAGPIPRPWASRPSTRTGDDPGTAASQGPDSISTGRRRSRREAAASHWGPIQAARSHVTGGDRLDRGRDSTSAEGSVPSGIEFARPLTTCDRPKCPAQAVGPAIRPGWLYRHDG